MKSVAKWLPLLAAIAFAAVASAASQKMVCSLTGKEVKTCCCEIQKNGTFLCKLTGKTLEKCCCTGM